MAPRGPAPKPAHLRQRTNKKAGAGILHLAAEHEDVAVPVLPNPDPEHRIWHPLTLSSWSHAWQSAMASQWMQTDADVLARLALMWDDYYKAPDTKTLAEIRLQEQRFGLTPLDRSRLQWEVNRAEEAEHKQHRRVPLKRASGDPRVVLMAVK